jgi:Zn finger protein HypA/HybF involved in hydrogenase expression
MIKIDISLLIFFYIFFSAVVILLVWVTTGYKEKRDSSLKDVEYIWKCKVCSNVYIDSRHEDMSECPLCGSYNKRDEEVLK